MFSLEHVCLNSIARNVLRHSLRYNILLRKGEPAVEYIFLQRRYSNHLLAAISNQLKAEVWYEHENNAMYNFLTTGHGWTSEVEECISYICNEHLESFWPCEFNDIALFDHVLPKVIANCRDLKEINLSHRCLPDHALHSILQSLPELRKLDLRCTNVNDGEFINIWRFCPNLEYLNLKFTNVSDLGIFFVCNQICSWYHRTKERMPTREIKYLYLTDSFTTTKGLECALDNLHCLKILAGNKNYSMSHNDVITAMTKLLRERDAKRVFKLRDAYFNDLVHSLEDMKLCVAACPELETLTLKFFNERSKRFFSISKFPNLKKVVLHTYLPLINTENFLDFLREKGERLESLCIHLSWQMLHEVTYRGMCDTCKETINKIFYIDNENKMKQVRDKGRSHKENAPGCRKRDCFEITIKPFCHHCTCNGRL